MRWRRVAHLIVAHVRSTNDHAVVAVVEDPETPDASTQLIRVFTRPKVNCNTILEVEGAGHEGVQLRLTHCVAIVIWIFALDGAAFTIAPWAVLPPLISDFAVHIRRKIHEGRPRVNDRVAVSEFAFADAHAINL
eukprot:scaffold182198_cov29-Tisochrysis_lutea.AAC.3